MLNPELQVSCYVVIFSIFSVLFFTTNISSSKDENLKMTMNRIMLRKNASKTSEIPRSKRIVLNESQLPQMITETEIEGWEKGVDRGVKKYFDPFRDTAIVSGRELCKPKTDIVIIIPSAPIRINERAAIRQTWASTKVKGVKVGFLLGHTASPYIESMIDQENASYNDIIQERFTDSYNNLTLKTLILLDWFLRNCPSQKFLVKADDDTFINVRILAYELSRLPASGILRGFPSTEQFVNRNNGSRRYVPVYMYSRSTFPVYLSGAGYFMSRDVVAKLYNASFSTPILHLEDVYITGLCAKKAGVEPKIFERAKHMMTSPKDCTVFYAMCHGFNPNLMYTLWEIRHPQWWVG